MLGFPFPCTSEGHPLLATKNFTCSAAANASNFPSSVHSRAGKKVVLALRWFLVARPQPLLRLSAASCSHRHRWFRRTPMAFYTDWGFFYPTHYCRFSSGKLDPAFRSFRGGEDWEGKASTAAPRNLRDEPHYQPQETGATCSGRALDGSKDAYAFGRRRSSRQTIAELLPIYDGSYTNKRACWYRGDTIPYADQDKKDRTTV